MICLHFGILIFVMALPFETSRTTATSLQNRRDLSCRTVKVFKCSREDMKMQPPSNDIKRKWCDGYSSSNCEVGYTVFHRHPVYYTYNYDVMVKIRRDLNLGMSHESDEIKFCYRHRSKTELIDAAQAMCRQAGLGDAMSGGNSYITARQEIYDQFGEYAEKRTWLAYLKCPQLAKGIEDCNFEFLEPGATCYLIEANCVRATCFDHNNAIYATRWRRYGQICKSGCMSRYCLRCRPSCKPNSVHTGYVYYDPHFRTLDDAQFSFMGTCTYTLIKTDEVTIEGKYDPCGKDQVTCLRRVTIKTRNTELILLHRHDGEKKRTILKEKGVEKKMSIPYTNKDIAIYEASSEFDTVDIWCGIKVAWDWRSEVIFGLNDNYKGKKEGTDEFKVKGLFGNYDGNPANDMMKPNGELEPDPDLFGESWRIDNSECGDSVSNLTQSHARREKGSTC